MICQKLGGDGSMSAPGWPGGGRNHPQKTTLKYLGMDQKELIRERPIF